ncbi:hypothetical protein [Domibacillus enclensis]|uniref:Uncharacterized protein n=1 Tax=Domibacillus enclensis TaxID=1017273 RepID=A0A1N7ABZ8_9BACI|nr:hypothetical protein [Domibacillus enclensis]OXS75765.1 hypothetical protein B1B05_14640 [Domibacillus enclensis]SIR36529.1 hypothetical protein SAMN05443094_107149 [Domibacillus enclensis]
MSQTQDLHHTNETVRETGTYICAAGKRAELTKGDTFPVCPKSNEPTTWRHADHVHHTGDQVTEADTYIDEDGDQVELAPGDTFPSCPKSGESTNWKHA